MHNSGSQVVSDNAQGGATPGFFTAVLGALSTGVRGIIDIELAERAGSIPDQADLRENTPAIDPSPAVDRVSRRFSKSNGNTDDRRHRRDRSRVWTRDRQV